MLVLVAIRCWFLLIRRKYPLKVTPIAPISFPVSQAFEDVDKSSDWLYHEPLSLAASRIFLPSSIESFFFLGPGFFFLFTQGELSRFDFSPCFMRFMAEKEDIASHTAFHSTASLTNN